MNEKQMYKFQNPLQLCKCVKGECQTPLCHPASPEQERLKRILDKIESLQFDYSLHANLFLSLPKSKPHYSPGTPKVRAMTILNSVQTEMRRGRKGKCPIM